MTDYCQTRLTIKGTPEEIAGFARDCLRSQAGVHKLDFEKIIPMPPIVRGVRRIVASKLGGDFSDALSSGIVGMEALRRTPWMPPDGTPAQSVLSHARVRALGLATYDDLERWLRDHDPDSLDLGRRCIAALNATGHCFEDDWVTATWGVDPERMDYQESRLTKTRYKAAFTSPWCAPEGIFREIARRYPNLTARIAALEEGNEYTFLLTVRKGRTKEQRPPVTDAFVEELEGAAETKKLAEWERAFYERTATLRKPPMRHVRHWWSEAALRRALTGYPVYEPPHPGIEMSMPLKDARENYEFFLAEKDHRVEALRHFLAPFRVPLGFNERTKTGLDRWLATYAALLYVAEDGCSFLTHKPPWTGLRSGLNVIFDLGIFLGEFAIHESPMLRWSIDDRKQAGRTRLDQQFQRPVLTAAGPLLSFPRDVIYHDMYQFCHSQCEASYMWADARFEYERHHAHNFMSKTLRHIWLSARGDFETANNEAREDWFAR